MDLGQIHLHELNVYYYFLVLLCLWYFELVKESGKYDGTDEKFKDWIIRLTSKETD